MTLYAPKESLDGKRSIVIAVVIICATQYTNIGNTYDGGGIIVRSQCYLLVIAGGTQ